MLFQNISADLLFHDPHILEKYLEDIYEEIQVPYLERLKQNEEDYDLSGRINANSKLTYPS